MLSGLTDMLCQPDSNRTANAISWALEVVRRENGVPVNSNPLGQLSIDPTMFRVKTRFTL